MIHFYLRKGTLEDLPEMQELFVATIRAHCVNDYGPEQISAWTSSIQNTDRWKFKINHQYIIVAVEQSDEKIVGYGSLEGGNYVDFLYVHKDYFRHGIATRILRALEKKALEAGASTILSHVSITALPFFIKNGFIVLQKQINTLGKVEIVNYKMVKHCCQ